MNKTIQASNAAEAERHMARAYALDELKDLPTLCVSQADNLKIDTGAIRVWLCRCGVADGMPYDHAVTIERQIDGRWTQVDQYPAD